MTYPYIPIGLIALFVIYVVYLAATRKTRQLRSVLPLGLFFIAIWAVIYCFLLQ